MGYRGALSEAAVYQFDVLGSERKRVELHSPAVPEIPMSFHDAFRGMPIGPFEHMGDLMGQYMRQKRRIEPLFATAEQSFEQHVDAVPGLREWHGIGQSIRRDAGLDSGVELDH
jgi:hypothetical protein